ncbi:ribosome small subunit-dependent GTPase A [Aeoliella mucimassa]|uniref:Small ribosomal subunit biogenesis GTPase RsgA n=1 Tax=Aeoliella mucimassa TaxID=2527972 RepID=A0A518ARP4_9BACT|nr:ribosome small subunit-dependent GTPase A [Aeoliella mucimassa]QDU57403.1 Putative ribosome biogenesis GTPase RsgA [Aeoliella mucimassa]
MSRKKKKIRASFRKNREVRTRENDLTRSFGESDAEDHLKAERISGKGSLSRKRTVAGGELIEDEAGSYILPDVDTTICREGRVLRVQGLVSIVRDDQGQQFRCATRRLLKTLSTDQRHVVAAGDHVWFRPEGDGEGIIERVEPRHGLLSRTSRGRQHVLVANVDQMIIVASAAEPRIKPNLIDRYLLTAEKTEIRPVVCINKIDLLDPAELMPLVGVYSQLGYQVLLVSATTGQNVAQLRALLSDRNSVLTGQSGVGKSSLLNAIEPGLGLRVQTVSAESQKGRHTTTTAELFPLECGGHVIDTPGIRQFQLWDVIPEEVAGFFRELRPYVSQCRFPDCTHTHEAFCAVKDAVADNRLDFRRYESYMQIQAGDEV